MKQGQGIMLTSRICALAIVVFPPWKWSSAVPGQHVALEQLRSELRQNGPCQWRKMTDDCIIQDFILNEQNPLSSSFLNELTWMAAIRRYALALTGLWGHFLGSAASERGIQGKILMLHAYPLLDQLDSRDYHNNKAKFQSRTYLLPVSEFAMVSFIGSSRHPTCCETRQVCNVQPNTYRYKETFRLQHNNIWEL